MFVGENLLQLLSYMTGISRTMPFCADSYLQVAAFDNRRHKKITKVRLIDYITQNLQFLTILVYPFVELTIIRCGYSKHRFRKIIFGILRSN